MTLVHARSEEKAEPRYNPVLNNRITLTRVAV
jgi:hypothetical protein